MARKVIDTGVVGNDGTGDSIRDSFRKVNENFRELYGALGLGTKLSFLSLDEIPDSYAGQENSVLAVNPTESGMMFKQLKGGTGISLDFAANENEITITNTVATISADTAPRLGGNLQAQSGGNQFRIQALTTPITGDEASNKAYTDTKIALGGVFAPDPAAGNVANSAFGTMTGPLLLSRNPRPEDDVTYGGLIAATKNYVDNAGFGSFVNLYVATSGNDARLGVGSNVQGRALAYAYKTLEAALKRAEEIIRGSRLEIGPYKKVLTWTDPLTSAISKCTLTDIGTSPDSGNNNFAGRVTLTVDTIRLVLGGFNYQVGEILKINIVGGLDINAATLEVLTVASAPGTPNGPILTYRLLTGGLFDGSLPVAGVSGVVVTAGSTFGNGGTFAIDYKVSTAIIEAGGTGYSLVSVRVEPDALDTEAGGAFGFADVAGAGVITGVTITDGGSGFTMFPNLVVDLPRFRIYTGGFRTDFTGDVTTDSSQARRGRDIREGLFIYGETSGALAQILGHQGELDTAGNELFDVDIKYGNFELGEEISYGDVANTRQISVFVESGIYYENLPLKIPQNVAIIGDEFRRTIIRPAPGVSSSPWAFQNFRRDRIIDGLNTAKNETNAARTDEYGYHYLADADEPVYPLINNRGFFRSASALLALNKAFIQEEVIYWTNKQINDDIAPYVNFEYNEDLCKRDVGLIIDAMCFDLLYGGYARIVSAALKYKGPVTALGDPALAIGDQLTQTVATIRRLETVAQAVIRNARIVNSSYTNPIIGTVYSYVEPQVVDTAYSSEAGAGGVRVTVASAVNSTICTITTTNIHGLINGDIVTFDGMEGMTQLNGNSYWVTVATTFSFNIFSTQGREVDGSGVNSTNFGVYVSSSGDVIPGGGVIGALTDTLIDIISNSGSVNYPLDNDQMDVFLCNDAVIGRAMTVQGAGGFAVVLDPEGQILAKSPYFQEGAVFSKSTGRQTFAGGMFIDGFAGNLRFRITERISATRIKVAELTRFPQLPASFIVEDTVYRINYVRDYVYGTTGSTATFVLDETTPWPYPVFVYNELICYRDAGLILTGVGYDFVLGTNYWQRKSGLSYRQANATVVVSDQLDLTIRAVEYAHTEAAALLPGTEYASVRSAIGFSKTYIANTIRRGVVAAPTFTVSNPTGMAANATYGTNIINAKNLLLSNIEYIKDVVVAYLTYTYQTFTFDETLNKRDTEYTVQALVYDLLYGGNSQTRSNAFRYFDGVGDAVVAQYDTVNASKIADGITKAKTVAKDIIQNNTVSITSYVVTAGGFIVGRQYTIKTVGSTTNWTAIGASSANIGITFTATGIGSGNGDAYVYISTTQVKDLSNPSNATIAGWIENLMAPIATAVAAVSTSGVVSEVLPSLTAYRRFDTTPSPYYTELFAISYDTTKKLARTTLETNKTTIQSAVIDFVDLNSNRYEILMPGNRSMLSNDFTQINDMGYGLLTTNGGLAEAVSMFTYYCYTSYYSLNGGQIRSVGGSSAHGVYALAAEGSDPLEVPTPVDLYYDLSQGARVYNDGSIYDNEIKGLIIYVGDWEYTPLNQCEVEVDHGGQVGLVRYSIVSAVTEENWPITTWDGASWTTAGATKPIYRLNLNSKASEGLVAEVLNGSTVSIRVTQEIILTGDVVGVAVRPSTALKLNETFTTDLYRVLSFADYNPPATEDREVSFNVSSSATFTTLTNHNQKPGYQVKFVTTPDSTGSLSGTGIIPGDPYYIIDEGFSNTTFKVALTLNGSPIETFSIGSGPHYFISVGLARTLLKDGYNYIEMTAASKMPFAVWGEDLFTGMSGLVAGQVYKIISLGDSTTTAQWNAIGVVGSPSVGATFTANGDISAGGGTVFANSTICTFNSTTDKVLKNSHGFNDGDVIRFHSSGVIAGGLFDDRQYFVYNKTANDFQLVGYPGSTTVIDVISAGTGTHGVGLVIGKAGDSTFAVVGLGPVDVDRVVGSKFNFKGSNYTVTQYDSPDALGKEYALLSITPALVNSILNFESPITMFSGVPIRSDSSEGTLTIRIALTRVTSHDLLEIGTGSYADTNYPNEIYGPPVRIATETLLDTTGEAEYSQVVERGEGRCFFVTTDQFGNFSVGPFFRVDQGTGSVSFSASLALSNLSGLGFKRGVPISEFSTDTSMTDNATDTVPTENAVRTYIDRRLGLTHRNAIVESIRLIPQDTGGFMALNGALPMKGDMSLGDGVTNFRVTNVADPVALTDAVNLQSIKFSNLIDLGGQDFIRANNLLVFTGVGQGATSAQVVGDISFNIDSTAYTVDAQINPDTIINADVKSDAGIIQSKLSMTLAAADTSTAPTGTAAQKQAANGLAHFHSSEFTVTDGFTELKINGITVSKLAQVATETVLGRSVSGTGDVSAVAFSTIVNQGGGIKKNQYSTTGFLRRTGTTTFSQDSDYTVVEAISAYTGFTDTGANGRIVIRDSSGDFAGRDVYGSRAFYIGTSTPTNKKFVDASVTASGGTINVYGFSGVLGVSIGDGSLTTDKVTTYRNNSHRFRLNDDSGFATIQASSITGDTFTTGGATTAGNLTGSFTLSGASNLTLGTGTINASSGTLQSATLTAGTNTAAGTLTGNWSLGSGSILNAPTGTTLQSRTLTTGAVGTTGTLTGNWSLASGSKIDFTSSTLQSTTLTTGAAATAGTITGAWSLAANSAITMPSSATLTAPTLTTGAAGTAGTLTGNWSMGTTSNLTLGTGTIDASTGTLKSITLTTGAVATAGTLTGNWSMSGASNLTLGTGSIDARTGELYADTLNTGAAGTAGLITGAWTLGASSTLVASSISGQTNSATTTATSSNTINQIVLRDGSGNFSAGTIGANLTGDVTGRLSYTVTGTNGANLVSGAMADNDFFRLRIGGDAVNSGWVELATADDGTEPIYVRQYTGAFATLTRTATLLDGSGNTSFPGSVTATSSLITTTLTTGAAATAGTVTGNWTLSAGSKMQATYADLAEYYEGDKEYAVGTVLVFGGDKEVTTSGIKGDTRVAGVVSDTGAYIMNSDCPGIKICVALQGRVPVKVVGKIKKGDILISSGIHGVAIVGGDNIKVGTMIGKALQDYDSDFIGTIEVAVGRT
jgi:hypothetical protein